MIDTAHLAKLSLNAVTLAFSLVLLLNSSVRAKGADADIRIPFPKAVGTWWHYTGRALTLGVPGKSKRGSLRLELTDRRSEITDASVEKPDVIALRLKDTKRITDTKSTKTSSTTTYSTAIIFGGKQYYLQPMSDRDWNSLKGRIARGAKITKPTSNFLEMQLPCVLGNSWGDASDVPRSDGLYCWHVDGVEVAHHPEDYGFSSPLPIKKFVISMRTGVDTTRREFMPGVGFIRTLYRHNAGVEKSTEKLKEWGHRK